MAFDPVSAALDLGGKLVDKLFPDPAKKVEALLKLEELRQSGDLAIIGGQLEVDKIEAANPNLFVSGWRPGIGWVCGIALATQMVIGPMVAWGAALAGKVIVLPHMDTELLTTLLVGMLGLGGLRTVEKLQGVASK